MVFVLLMSSPAQEPLWSPLLWDKTQQKTHYTSVVLVSACLCALGSIFVFIKEWLRRGVVKADPDTVFYESEYLVQME